MNQINLLKLLAEKNQISKVNHSSVLRSWNVLTKINNLPDSVHHEEAVNDASLPAITDAGVLHSAPGI